MKKFLSTFAACLVLVYIVLSFGGWQLFDFSSHWFLACGSVALILAIFVSIWLSQEERLESLEKRIKELEELKEKQE